MRRFRAVLGKLAGVDAGGAERNGGELVLEGPEVEVALAVREVEEREAEPLPEGRPLAEGPDQVLVERADRPTRHAVLGGVAEDDVLVTVVVRRADAHLRPFPAEVGDEIRAPRIAGHRVALPDGLFRLAPVLRGDRLGVVGDAPEVQAGAEAREIARVGGRVSALALQHRQAPDERVGREGGVDVEVTEEDLLPRCLCRGHGSGRDGRGGNRRPGRRTGLLVTPATAGDEHRHDDDSWPASHGSPPSRMCRESYNKAPRRRNRSRRYARTFGAAGTTGVPARTPLPTGRGPPLRWSRAGNAP